MSEVRANIAALVSGFSSSGVAGAQDGTISNQIEKTCGQSSCRSFGQGRTNISADVLLSPRLAETFPDVVVAVDHEGNILQTNSLTEELFGYTRDELVVQKIEVLVPERHRVQHHGHRADFAEHPKVRRMGDGT